jgi:hypothetical protein
MNEGVSEPVTARRRGGRLRRRAEKLPAVTAAAKKSKFADLAIRCG